MSVRYLLDTNICIYIAKHNPATTRERFKPPARSSVTTIFGWQPMPAAMIGC
jgi:predicted nucleic acid-binding protein